MSDIISLINISKEVGNYNEKTQIISALINRLQGKRKISAEDVEALSNFAFTEVRALIPALNNAENYREKSDIMDYEDALLGMLMGIYQNPNDIPQTEMVMIKTLVDNVNKERRLQSAI